MSRAGARPLTSPPRDRNDLVVLSPAACWDLLETARFGRLAFLDAGRPMILPIHHLVVEGRELAFRTREGAKLDSVRRRPGAPASFEVDDIDLEARRGWSVVVTGRLSPILDQVRAETLDASDHDAWVPSRHGRWIRMVVDDITGRMLTD